MSSLAYFKSLLLLTLILCQTFHKTNINIYHVAKLAANKNKVAVKKKCYIAICYRAKAAPSYICDKFSSGNLSGCSQLATSNKNK